MPTRLWPKGWWSLLLTLGFLWGPGVSQAATLEDRTLSFETAQAGLTRSFAPELGELRGPVTQSNTVWLGIGPELYGYDQTGQVLTRLDFPGPIVALDTGTDGTATESAGSESTGATQGLLTVTAGFPGAQSTYNVTDGTVHERVVFAPLPEVTGWLEQAANLATPAQVKAAQTTDPTNPFLALRHAQQLRKQGDTFGALDEVQRTAGIEVPFFAALRVAALMEAQQQTSAANLMLSRAARDYAARGYNPAVPVSLQALVSYGNPLATINDLLRQGRLSRADVWLRYLRTVSPRFEGSAALYERYATLLDRAGRGGEADEWRSFSRSLNVSTLYDLGPTALLSLQEAAHLSALALLLTVLAAYSVLLARTWPLQTRDLSGAGGRLAWQRPLWRLRHSVLSYAGVGEKLVVVSLLAGLTLSLLGWTWATRTQQALVQPALNMGTYGGAWFYDQLGELQNNPDAALLRGLSAQLDGDETQARRSYQLGLPAEGSNTTLANTTAACIQNNLGVLLIQQDNPAEAREQWRLALSAAPDLLSARYNLGQHTDHSADSYLTDSRVTFQRQNLPTQAMLCYPDQRSTISALGGNLAGLVRQWRLHPVHTLLSTPTGLSLPWQWAWVLTLLVTTAYSVLMLFWSERPIHERLGATLGGLPRGLAYRVLVVIFPGSALLDQTWGAVLLLTWAAGVVQALARLGWVPFGHITLLSNAGVLTLLLVSYALNTAFLSAKQRRYWHQLALKA